jgi:hypothetical protein
MPQQRHLPVLLPRVRRNGGASPACRRFLRRKSRNMVALPLIPAVHRGGNIANCVNLFSGAKRSARLNHHQPSH